MSDLFSLQVLKPYNNTDMHLLDI